MFPLSDDPVVFGEPGEIPLLVMLLRTAKNLVLSAPLRRVAE